MPVLKLWFNLKLFCLLFLIIFKVDIFEVGMFENRFKNIEVIRKKFVSNILYIKLKLF